MANNWKQVYLAKLRKMSGEKLFEEYNFRLHQRHRTFLSKSAITKCNARAVLATQVFTEMLRRHGVLSYPVDFDD